MAIQINNATSPAESQIQSTESQKVAGNEVVSGSVEESSATPSVLAANPQMDRETLEAVVSNINDYVQNIQRSIHFSVSESSGRTIIEVYDSETDELIREIPPEEVQRISEALAEQLNVGLLAKTNI